MRFDRSLPSRCPQCGMRRIGRRRNCVACGADLAGSGGPPRQAWVDEGAWRIAGPPESTGPAPAEAPAERPLISRRRSGAPHARPLSAPAPGAPGPDGGAAGTLARLDPASRRTFRRIVVESAVLAVLLATIYGGPLIRGGESAPAPAETPYAGPLLDISVLDVTGLLEQERLGAFVFTAQRTGTSDVLVTGESDASGTIVDLAGPSWNLREIHALMRASDGDLDVAQRRDLGLLLALLAPDALGPLQAALEAAVAGDGAIEAEAESGRIVASLQGRLELGGTLRLTLSVAPGVDF